MSEFKYPIVAINEDMWNKLQARIRDLEVKADQSDDIDFAASCRITALETRVAEQERQVKNLHSFLVVEPAPAPFRADKPGWYRMRCGGVVEVVYNDLHSEWCIVEKTARCVTWNQGGYVYSKSEPVPFDLIEYLGTEKPE